MTKLLSMLAAALLLGAATAGCGSTAAQGGAGHSLSPSEQKAANAMSSYLAKNGNGSISQGDARCIARGWVGRTGVAKLKQSKILTGAGQVNTQSSARITPSLANDYASALLDCIDYAKLQSQAVAKANPGVDAQKMAACFVKAMPKVDEKKLLVTTMTGHPDRKLSAQNAQAIQTCQAKAKKAKQ